MICRMDPNRNNSNNYHGNNSSNYHGNNSNNYENLNNRKPSVIIINNYREKTKEEKKEEKRRKKEKKLQKELNKQAKNAIEEAKRAIRLKKEKRERKYRDILYYSGRNIADILSPYLDYLKKRGGKGITKLGGFYYINKDSILESWHYDKHAGAFALKFLLSFLVFFILVISTYYLIINSSLKFIKNNKSIFIGISIIMLIIFLIIYLINVYPLFDARRISQEDKENIQEIENVVLKLNDNIEEFNYKLLTNN